MEFDFEKNATVTDLNVVPEAFRGLYAQGEGGYSLGEAFKPVAAAITGLNGALKAARADAKKGKVDLSALATFGETPEAIISGVQAKIAELEGELAKGAKINPEKIKEELSRAHAAELGKRDKRVEALQGQLYNLLVENNATAAVAEAKGIPELLMPFIKQQVKVVEENGQIDVYVVDAQGDRRYSGTTGQPMTIKELVASMKADQKFGRLFESDAQTGGGTPPGAPTRKPAQQPPNLNPVDKIAAGLRARQRR